MIRKQLLKLVNQKLLISTKQTNISSSRYLTNLLGFKFYSNQYIQPWQVPMKSYVELTQAIGNSHTCNMIGQLFRDNYSILTDYQISYGIFQIYNNKLEVDEPFYDIIVPVLKDRVAKFDRECNKSLGEIVKHCGWLCVNDEPLWELFEQKLIKEGLYRYLPLKEVCEVCHAFAFSGKGSPQLYSTLENYIIKHRLGLTQPMKVYVKDAFLRNKAGSKLLFTVLENPTLNLKSNNIELEKKSFQ